MDRRSMLTKTTISLIVLAALGGCSSVHDDVNDESNSDLVVHPAGNDPQASLLVTLPAGTSANGLDIAFDNVRVTPGVASKVPAAKGCLQITGANAKGTTVYSARDCNVTTVANQTTTYALGAVTEDAPTTNVFGWSPDAASSDTAVSWTASTPNANITAGVFPNGLRLPGTYRVRFGFWDGVEVSVTANKSIHVNYSDISHRRTARLVVPARSFPDAKGLERTYYLEAFNDAHAFPGINPDLPTKKSAPFTLERDLVVGEFEKEQPSRFFLVWEALAVSPSEWPHVPFTLGPPGTTTDFVVGRIDVDDVDVVQPDGSTKKVPGFYRISVKQTDGTFAPYLGSVASYATKTGFDAPPGTYAIETSYVTTGNVTKTDTVTVSVP